jgi:hypothetical protein
MKRATLSKTVDRAPKTHTVVKRKVGAFGIEFFCTRCQRIVKDANERCRGKS